MKRKKSINMINTFMTVILFAVLFMTVFSVISMKASDGQASVFGYQFKSVLSGSMEPAIQTGALIAVNETDADHKFAKGDIITFLADGDIVVTHRIDQVKEKGKTYITKGDANDATDSEPVQQEDIIGEYNGLNIPYIGYVMTFLNSGEGAALLMVIPGIGLIIYSIVQFKSVFKRMNQPRNEMESSEG